MYKTKEDHAQSLADYLPGGYTFESKNVYNSNLRALLRGLASELKITQDYITTFEHEYFPDTTTLFLSEWESALQIPDDCLIVEETNEKRLRNIIVKLGNMNLQAKEDFVDLAALFGIHVTVTPGADLTGEIAFDSITTARNTIVIDFPLPPGNSFTYDFSIIFGDLTQSIIKCLFEKQRPAHAVLLFR